MVSTSPAAGERKVSDSPEALEIRDAHGPAGAALISQLFDEIWSVEGMVPPEIITACLHNGGYGSVAWLCGEPVGAAFAVVGLPLQGESGPNLHSHAAGVVVRHGSRDIGRHIKHHQWWWAKKQGFATLTWTFDPLVRRNAWFNIVKLGVQVLGYHVNFYGELNDGINAGEQSDRLLVQWPVAIADSPPSGALVDVLPSDVTIATPENIEAMRNSDKGGSDRWRIVQRSQFLTATSEGRSVAGLNADFDYVLRGAR